MLEERLTGYWYPWVPIREASGLCKAGENNDILYVLQPGNFFLKTVLAEVV